MQNLTDLENEVRKWLDSRSLLDGQVEMFTRMVESYLNRNLLVEDMLTLTRLYVTQESGELFALPEGFRGARFLKYGDRDLEHVSPEQMNLPQVTYLYSGSSVPRLYTKIGNYIQIYPPLEKADPTDTTYSPPTITTANFRSVSSLRDGYYIRWTNPDPYDTLKVIVEHTSGAGVETYSYEVGNTDIEYSGLFPATAASNSYRIWLLGTQDGGTGAKSNALTFTPSDPYLAGTNPSEDSSEILGSSTSTADYLDLWNYQNLIPLGATTTNWLIQRHSDIYLAGVLTEANLYLMDEQRAVIWQNRFQAALEELKDADDAKGWPAGSMQMRCS
jgi:hypothetical protein